MKKRPIFWIHACNLKSLCYICNMDYKKEWKYKSGIYSIRCKITGKQYIGKSSNLYNRLKSHTTTLNRELPKYENQYLINAWKKYGEHNFEYIILEYCTYEKLSERELFFILKYKTNNRIFGYNLRLDSSSGMLTTEETRKKLSISQKLRQQNMSIDEKEKVRQQSSNMWKKWSKKAINNVMTKVALTRTKYNWFQYTKDGILVKQWDCIRNILKENPSYKRHNIYAVASGEKPSIYGYIWKKVSK